MPELAIVAGPPPVIDAGGNINVGFELTNIAEMRSALVAGTADCTGVDLGAWGPVAATVPISETNAGRYTLCVQGRSADGTETPTVAVPSKVLGFIDVTPTARPLSPDTVELSWTPPTGTIVRYDLHAAAGATLTPGAATIVGTDSTGSLSTKIVTLPSRGFVGKSVVRAWVDVLSPTAVTTTPASIYTPHPPLNVEGISDIIWNVGHDVSFYSEATAVTERFSVFISGFYSPTAAAAYVGIPTSGLQVPAYNFLSGIIATAPNGFQYGGVADIGQIWTDGLTKMAIAASWAQNRVLLYNHLPVSPDLRVPDAVIGQPNFVSVAANGGGSVSEFGLSLPSGVCWDGTTLYVGDYGNNRVLGWNSWPATGAGADFVLGQADFTQNAANRGGTAAADTISAPGGLMCRGNKLVVADSGNNRVLVFAPAPRAAAPASMVLGHLDMTTVGANDSAVGGSAGGGLNKPNNVAYAKHPTTGLEVLLIGDWFNARVVQFDEFPTQNGQSFDLKYSGRFGLPWNVGPELDLNGDPKEYFWVSDGSSKRRWLRWHVGDNTETLILGQRNSTELKNWFENTVTTRHVPIAWAIRDHRVRMGADPSGLFAMGGLLWESPPADGTVDGTLGFSGSIARFGNRIYWPGNENILSVPYSGGVPATPTADVILGRKNATGGVIGSVPDTWEYKVTPSQVLINANKLYALDGPRIVVWNTPPAVSGVAIDAVIGQTAVTSRDTNRGGAASDSSLGAVTEQMMIANNKLYVADTNNNRIMVWDGVPTTDRAADYVLGQSTFTGTGVGTALNQMDHPSGIAVLNGKLIVADSDNGRLLIWNTVPSASGVAADRTYSMTAERYQLPVWFNPDYLRPYELVVANGKLYVETQERVFVLPDLWP